MPKTFNYPIKGQVEGIKDPRFKDQDMVSPLRWSGKGNETSVKAQNRVALSPGCEQRDVGTEAVGVGVGKAPRRKR